MNIVQSGKDLSCGTTDVWIEVNRINKFPFRMFTGEISNDCKHCPHPRAETFPPMRSDEDQFARTFMHSQFRATPQVVPGCRRFSADAVSDHQERVNPCITRYENPLWRDAF